MSFTDTPHATSGSSNEIKNTRDHGIERSGTGYNPEFFSLLQPLLPIKVRAIGSFDSFIVDPYNVPSPNSAQGARMISVVVNRSSLPAEKQHEKNRDEAL